MIIVAAVGYFQMESPNNVTDKKENITLEEKTEEKSVPVTGNVDDVAAAILADGELDVSLFAEETGDTALLDVDGQAVGDFGGVYNENEF